MVEAKRSHKKVRPEDVKVWPRKEWTALKTQNQILIFGFLVYKTEAKKTSNYWKKQRFERPTEADLLWNCVRVSNDDLSRFLRANTNIKPSSCRKAIKRTLEYLHSIGYIVLHGDSNLVNRYSENRPIEVLWQNGNKDERRFITPRIFDVSNSSGTLSGTKTEEKRDTSGTKMPSSGTPDTLFVPLENPTYGPTKPRIEQNRGASLNTEYLIPNSTQPAPENVFVHSCTFSSTELQTASLENENETDVPRETSTSLAIISDSELLPAFRMRMTSLQSRFGAAFDNPVKVWSFAETKGIKGSVLPEMLLELLEHIKVRYGYDAAYIFEAQNYRRLICPDLRADLPLEFDELEEGIRSTAFLINPKNFDECLMFDKVVKACPDMFHKVVTVFRLAPRGIRYSRDNGGYWSPPVFPLVFETNPEEAAVASPFYFDATLTQANDIIFPDRLPDIETDGVVHSAIFFNVVLKRQKYWLSGVTAMSPEALEGMVARFTKDLLHTTKSPIYIQYQKIIKSGNFSGVNLIDWFVRLCLRYHRYGWYIDRIKTEAGGLFLGSLGENCATDGAAPGVIAYIPTPWNGPREMYFTDTQWTNYENRTS